MFLIYNKTVANNLNKPDMMPMNGNEQMGEPPEKPDGDNKNPGINGPGENSNSIEYSGITEITEDTTIENGEYSSEKADENAILVSGDAEVTLSNISVNKTGDSNGGDNTSFYGTNSSIIAKDGANVTLKNITVTTNATGANGVFSYGGSATTQNTSSDGTTINISDSQITTNKDNSGGIMATGGGILNASNLTINTEGVSSAAIRTDRGGGTVTVNDATLVAKTSEGIVIEGKIQ